ncbi:hypothetical protein [Paraburkholderia azotifigens]|uniref:TniQ family protein n=1 Tax=Paraburkholderia azotifigens TaxID=2057004 RepID=A0A5C6VM17_9BURK|nr:hypothetical protein [Paraburkholderia azotifigens]TXC84555.1 hypothetical protein FRZ40_30295 [Paraburkholderia azotifigens]
MNELRLNVADKVKRGKQWAGRDLSPLPHESALTILWRFGWRNVLGPPEIRAFLADGRKQIDWGAFKRIASWWCPEDTELRIERLPARKMFFDSCLRYCPICLECGYHSVWHQFRPLPSCPIHDVRLMSRCFNCRLPTTWMFEYLNDRTKPFRCKTCNGYLAGVEPNLDLHLDLRDQSAAIRDRLDRYDGWVTENHEVLALVEQLMDYKERRPNAEPAFKLLVYRLIDQMAPSADFSFGDGRPVGVFNWNIRPYRYGEMRRRAELFTSWSALGAYRNAIHKLMKRYIVCHDDVTRLQDAGCRIAGRQSLNIGALGASLVAIALTRHWIEGERWNVSNCADARQAFFSLPMPFPDCGTGRYLRIEVQAYVSALYATFLEAASRTAHSDEDVTASVLLAAGTGVGFAQNCRRDGITGMAIFPLAQVPSSPLRVHQGLPSDHKRNFRLAQPRGVPRLTVHGNEKSLDTPIVPRIGS